MFRFILAFLLAPATAMAITFVGNPGVSFTIEDPAGDLTTGDVLLQEVVVHPCDDADLSLSVNTWIDPVAGWSEDGLPDGDYCGVTLHWGSTLFLEGSNSNGVVEVEGTTTSQYIPLALPSSKVNVPHKVTVGNLPGGGPTLTLVID